MSRASPKWSILCIILLCLWGNSECTIHKLSAHKNGVRHDSKQRHQAIRNVKAKSGATSKQKATSNSYQSSSSFDVGSNQKNVGVKGETSTGKATPVNVIPDNKSAKKNSNHKTGKKVFTGSEMADNGVKDVAAEDVNSSRKKGDSYSQAASTVGWTSDLEPSRSVVDSLQLSSFALVFKLPEGTGMPLTLDYAGAVKATVDFLQPILHMVYDDALEFFSVIDTANQYTQDGPRIEFSSSIKFIEGKVAYDDEEIIAKIERVFSHEPFSAHFLQRLKNLDPDNIFQQTTEVYFLSKYNVDGPVRLHISRGPSSSVGVAGAFAGATLILAITGLMIHGGKRSVRSQMPIELVEGS